MGEVEGLKQRKEQTRIGKESKKKMKFMLYLVLSVICLQNLAICEEEASCSLNCQRKCHLKGTSIKAILQYRKCYPSLRVCKSMCKVAPVETPSKTTICLQKCDSNYVFCMDATGGFTDTHRCIKEKTQCQDTCGSK